MSGRRGGGDGDTDWIWEFLGFFGSAEESVDCGCCVEVGDIFSFEEFPDQGVVDFSKAVMGSPDCCYCPREC